MANPEHTMDPERHGGRTDSGGITRSNGRETITTRLGSASDLGLYGGKK
jgi:hypothetical protein